MNPRPQLMRKARASKSNESSYGWSTPHQTKDLLVESDWNNSHIPFHANTFGGQFPYDSRDRLPTSNQLRLDISHPVPSNPFTPQDLVRWSQPTHVSPWNGEQLQEANSQFDRTPRMPYQTTDYTFASTAPDTILPDAVSVGAERVSLQSQFEQQPMQSGPDLPVVPKRKRLPNPPCTVCGEQSKNGSEARYVKGQSQSHQN